MISLNRRVLWTCLLLVSWTPALAYIDPGTGSALIQGVIAAVAALSITLKLYWHRILGFFGRKRDKDSQSSDGDSNQR